LRARRDPVIGYPEVAARAAAGIKGGGTAPGKMGGSASFSPTENRDLPLY
jgi:hypothetical protein